MRVTYDDDAGSNNTSKLDDGLGNECKSLLSAKLYAGESG